MGHFGHGERADVAKWVTVLLLDTQYLRKWELILTGKALKQVFSLVLVGKLTVRYGHGDRIHTTNWA